ncbi:MAG TPA: threonine synthase [Thermoplasmata archaeon]|nr:threonine synthase [Thermoplasmata archaeon]
MSATGSVLASLDCRACCTSLAPDRPVGTCPTCGHTLFASYALDRIDRGRWREAVARRPTSLWRYAELLPVRDAGAIATLGEGMSPIVALGPVAEAPGVSVVAKDDGGLPTGSFKARGMAVAVSCAKELGLTELFVPSAGNAGVALAAYGARAGLATRIYLPEATSAAVADRAATYGAGVVRVGRTIREAGEAARTAERGRGSFDVSTLREPYRVEGKKTMGLEIFEQSAGSLPDAIVYPTGGGTGLVGMQKAFDELRALGLLERSPRLYAVQAEGCAPVVRALEAGAATVAPWADARTLAPGLLVPAPFASERILEAVRQSGGAGVAVSDRAIVTALRRLASRHGVSVSPEAAAPYAALGPLAARGWIRPGETVLLYLTGSGLPFSAVDLEGSLGP